MLRTRKPVLGASGVSTRFTIAVLFVIAAGFSALAHAETRSVEGFDIDTVVLRGSDELKIEWSDANRLLVKGDQKDLDRQPFYVRGKTLYLGYTEGRKRVKGVKYLLEANSLKEIELEGSGAIWVEPLETDELHLKVAGSGDIRAHDIKATHLELSVAGSGSIELARAESEKMEVEMAGSGDIALGKVDTIRLDIDMSGSGDIYSEGTGSAEDLEIGLAGSGDIDVHTIRATKADIGIAGSGDVYVWVEDDLEVGIIGSGDVHYHGDPNVDSSVMGSGEVTPAD